MHAKSQSTMRKTQKMRVGSELDERGSNHMNKFLGTARWQIAKKTCKMSGFIKS